MEIFLLVAALLLSGFFSGSEIAFVSVNRIEIEIWLRKRLKGAASAFYLSSQPERFLGTVLVGNNIVNIAFASLVTYYLQAYVNDFLIVLFNSVILLLLGEIIPKTIFREMAHRLVLALAWPLRFFYFLLFPIIKAVNFFAHCTLKLFGQTQTAALPFFSRKDIEILIHEGERVGVVEKDAWEIISRLFRLSSRRVREIMVPRTEIVFVRVTDTIAQIKKVFEQCPYSRLPVIEEDLDHICGVVYSADLLEKPTQLQKILRRVIFVPESKKCFDLLRQMKKEKMSLVILIDEYGGTSGVVTVEDIVEELFGEIQDEYDDERRLFHRLQNGSVVADGRAKVMQINEQLNWSLPAGNYETINGLILETIGRIPKTYDEVQIDQYKIKILGASNNRVQRVSLRPRVQQQKE